MPSDSKFNESFNELVIALITDQNKRLDQFNKDICERIDCKYKDLDEKISQNYKDFDEKISNRVGKLHERINTMGNEIGSLKVKSSIWGTISGAMGTGLTLLGMWFFGGGSKS